MRTNDSTVNSRILAVAINPTGCSPQWPAEQQRSRPTNLTSLESGASRIAPEIRPDVSEVFR